MLLLLVALFSLATIRREDRENRSSQAANKIADYNASVAQQWPTRGRGPPSPPLTSLFPLIQLLLVGLRAMGMRPAPFIRHLEVSTDK